MYCMQVYTLSLKKTPSSILREKWTDLNNFCCTESRGNFTSENCKATHLTWIMSSHYLVKRKVAFFAAYNLSFPPVHICNVQLTEGIIFFPSNKWVALTKAGWCVVCVVDYLVASITRWVAFHKVVRDCSRELVEFTVLWCEISAGTFCTPKIIKIDSFSASYSKYKRGVFETVYVVKTLETSYRVLFARERYIAVRNIIIV